MDKSYIYKIITGNTIDILTPIAIGILASHLSTNNSKIFK